MREKRLVIYGMIPFLLAYALLLLNGKLIMASPHPHAKMDLVLPPTPQPLPPTGDCTLDNIFYGAVPPGGEQGDVLVFVHGLSGLAEDWWAENTTAGLNDMYILAYNAGYRTAFVNLNVAAATPPECHVKRRPANDMMGNGKVLSQQLDAITQHYGVSQVDIIAHSKGGVDAQAATVWWGAWPKVRNVFTLGTPHQGSLLADLLWSPEGFWVSILLGQRDQATFSMRTGSMQLFRSLTDPATVDDNIHYYSGAGNHWNTPGTIYEITGEWLQNHPEGGDNDGAVTVASTSLAGAETLFLEPWNHAEVYLGRNAFPYILQVLEGPPPSFHAYLPLLYREGGAAASKPEGTAPDGERASGLALHRAGPMSGVLTSSYVLRGGRLVGSIWETLPIEDQVRTARFTLITTAEEVTATLIDPQGNELPMRWVGRGDQQGLFASASWLTRRMDRPAPGEWSVQMDGPSGAGYLLIVTLDSPLRVGLRGLPRQPVAPGQAVRLQAWAHDPLSITRIEHVRVRWEAPPWLTSQGCAMDGDMTCNVATANTMSFEEATAVGEEILSRAFVEEGVYGISVRVRGHTGAGWSFERSFVYSFAVAPARRDRDVWKAQALWPGR
ncbi:MAG TPA: hypothetical protein G4O02_02035 [Caldilineae bacterium]|nr:hypothetical protein [Caldilineae bacterium]